MAAMTTARAKAPTLAWLLTALACLLAGMAIVESRHQAAALPVWAPVGPVVTAEAAAAPTRATELTQPTTPEPPPTPILGPGEELAPTRTLLAEDAPAWPAVGTATLRLERLTLPPRTGLPPEVTSGPTVLLVEAGTLAVQTYGATYVKQGLDAAQVDTTLSAGKRLVIVAGARYAVRNDGPTPAVALVVTILHCATPSLSSDRVGFLP
jgi:hypothetical protein